MLEVQGLRLQYGDRVLFKAESFRLTERERVGIVGRNGAGKSTLLKIMMGMIRPDDGRVTMSKDDTIAMLGQELHIDPTQTVMDAAMEAYAEISDLEERLESMNQELSERTDYTTDNYAQLIDDITNLSTLIEMRGGQDREGNAEKVLKGLGFKQKDLYQPVNTFSGGWQMRVELSKLLLQEPTFLLLDEPTNHLDIESIIWLEKYFESYPGNIVIISHDVRFLDNTCKRILDIELGEIRDYKLNYSRYLEQKAMIREQQEAAFENQQKEIKSKERLIERFRAKQSKAKFAQSLIRQLDKMDRVELDQGDNQRMNIRFLPFQRSALEVLKADKVSKQYDDHVVLDQVDFVIERGQRIAFVGQNGQGKSTLVKLLLEKVPLTGGEVQIGNNAQVAYYAQNQADELDPSLTVLETMEADAPEEMRTRVRGILGSFLFSGEAVEKKVSVLSGGERARLALAKLVMRPINMLVLDEPTNHLDIIAKDVLKEALLNYEGTLLIVSHDRDFLSGLTELIYEFRDRKIHEFLGDINYFLDKREVDDMREIEKRSELKRKEAEQKVVETKPEPTMSHADRKALKNKIRKLERSIEDKEASLVEVETQLLDPEVFKSDKGHNLQIEHAKIKEEIESLTLEWEEAVSNIDD